MLLSPLLSYLSFGVMDLKPSTHYFKIFTVIYGFIFLILKLKKISIPNFAIFAFLWAVYIFLWSFFNGDFERRGLLSIIINNTSLAIFFVLIIVYNTKFSKRFISNSVKFFGYTVIISAIFSIIQVFDISFFNASSYWYEDKLIESSDIYENRRSSIFGFIDRNALGLSYIPLLSIFIGHILIKSGKLLTVYLILGATTSLFSNARYVIIGFLILTLQIFFSSKSKIKGALHYIAASIITFLIVIQLLQVFGYDLQEWYIERLFREESFANTTRFKAVETFVIFFPKYYLFGNGSISNEEVTEFSRTVQGSSHIHVGYLSHLVAFGIIGCFFLYGFWLLLSIRLYKTAKQSNYWGALFAFVTFWWAFLTFSQSSIFYYGLIFSLIFDKYYCDISQNNFNKKQSIC